MPSPYVSLYITRKQAEAALASLRRDAECRAKSNPLWRVVAELEKALAKNNDDAAGSSPVPEEANDG